MPTSEPSTITLGLHPLPSTMDHMIKQHNGAFLVNETAANDPICQQVMASYMNQLRAEAARRDRIRQGLEAAPEGQWGNWNISDRH